MSDIDPSASFSAPPPLASMVRESRNESLYYARKQRQWLETPEEVLQRMADAEDRWPEGSLVTTRSGQMGLVLGAPSVTGRGKPCLVLLIDANPVEVELSEIKKERRKKAKVAA